MAEALAGEINRRQEVLRAAGNLANVHDYERKRRAGAKLEPLPSLFVVIDEFSELLAQRPELIDLLVSIGRLGRSLEMHLLLPASGWTRAGCAGWSRTCPTGSRYARSPRRSPGRCSVSRTPTTCRRCRLRLPGAGHRRAGAVPGGVRLRAPGRRRPAQRPAGAGRNRAGSAVALHRGPGGAVRRRDRRRAHHGAGHVTRRFQ